MTNYSGKMLVKPKKINNNENFLVLHKMLAKYSHKITDIEAGNNPELTQNVRLLRDLKTDKVRM